MDWQRRRLPGMVSVLGEEISGIVQAPSDRLLVDPCPYGFLANGGVFWQGDSAASRSRGTTQFGPLKNSDVNSVCSHICSEGSFM